HRSPIIRPERPVKAAGLLKHSGGRRCRRSNMMHEGDMSNSRSGPVELVADSDPRFAQEENALLLVRLRAVTFLLSAGFALVLVRDMTFREGPVWQFQAAGTIAMAFLTTMLSAARSVSARGLKVAEAAVLGLAVG